jgi:hypothetical protein
MLKVLLNQKLVNHYFIKKQISQHFVFLIVIFSTCQTLRAAMLLGWSILHAKAVLRREKKQLFDLIWPIH